MQGSRHFQMEHGNAPIFIHTETLKSILDSIVRSTEISPEHAFILSYSIIDDFLLENDPTRVMSRTDALKQLLVQLIETEANRLRYIFDLKPLDIDSTLAVSLLHIQADNRLNKRSILDWNTLYYLYVRSDLDLSLKVLAKIANTSSRTQERYRVEALNKLREKIIELEVDSLKRHRQRQLLSQLPSKGVGEVAIRQEILKLLVPKKDDFQPKTIHIYGDSGSGKSFLIEQLAKQLIQTSYVERCVWISDATEVEQVYLEVQSTLVPHSAKHTINDVIAIYPTMIILDNVESLILDTNGFKQLINHLAGSVLIFTSRSPIIVSQQMQQIRVNPLNEQEANRYIEWLLKKSHRKLPSDFDTFCSDIWKSAVGNIRAIRIATLLYEHRVEQPSIWLKQLLTSLSKADFTSLLYYILGFTGVSDKGHQDDENLLPNVTDISNNLNKYDILAGDRETLLLLLREVVEEEKNNPTSVSLQLNDWLNDLYQFFDGQSLLIEYIPEFLKHYWLFDEKVWSLWIETFHHHILRDANLSRWKSILSEYISEQDSTPSTIELNYARCLRKLGSIEQAETILREMIEFLGHRGEFLRQAQARLELSVVLRQRGQYDDSLSILGDIETYVDILSDSEFTYELYLNFAQLYLDTNAGEELGKVVDRLRWWRTIDTMLIQSEYNLTTGNIRLAYTQANLVLDYSKPKTRGYSQACHLIGQYWYQEKNYHRALEFYSNALQFFDDIGMILKVGRIRTNIALALEKISEARQALATLEQVRALQQEIGDRVGLVITEANLKRIQLGLAK